MSDIVAVAVIAAIPPTLAGLASLWATIRGNRKADVNAVKTGQIAEAVNGQRDTILAEVATLKAEVTALKTEVTRLKSTGGE